MPWLEYVCVASKAFPSLMSSMLQDCCTTLRLKPRTVVQVTRTPRNSISPSTYQTKSQSRRTITNPNPSRCFPIYTGHSECLVQAKSSQFRTQRIYSPPYRMHININSVPLQSNCDICMWSASPTSNQSSTSHYNHMEANQTIDQHNNQTQTTPTQIPLTKSRYKLAHLTCLGQH